MHPGAVSDRVAIAEVSSLELKARRGTGLPFGGVRSEATWNGGFGMRAMGRGTMVALGLALSAAGHGAAAADLDVRGGSARTARGSYEVTTRSGPRFFPRNDGIDRPPVYAIRTRVIPVGCTPRQVPVPTNAPDDPSYVGSEYGLSHPSYYGFTPPLGVDDPFGRSLLPYCP